MTAPGFCTNCGAQLTGQPFCSLCGTPVVDQMEMAATPTARTVRLPETQAPPTIALGAPPAATARPSTATKPKRARIYTVRPKGRTAFILGGALLALLLLGGGGYWAWGRMGTTMASGVPKMLVMADEGDDRQTLYLMGLTSNDKTELDVMDTDARISNLSRVDDHSLRYGTGGEFLATQQRLIYFYQAGSDIVGIRSADLAGQGSVALSDGAPVTFGQVSETGGNVLIEERIDSTEYLLTLVDLAGKKLVLAEGTATASGVLAPNGKQVAYWTSESDASLTLKVVDNTGANEVELASDVPYVQAQWARDSSKLFVTLTEGMPGSSASSQARSESFVVDADGQNKHGLSTRGSIMQADVAQGLLIYSLNEGSGNSLYISKPDGSEKRSISRAVEGLQWRMTPDRHSVVFSETRNGRTTLQVAPIKAGDTVELARADYIGWDYDGDQIIVISYRNNLTTITRMDRQGQNKQEIVKGLSEFAGSDSLNGRVVFAGKDDDQARLQLWDGKQLQTLAEDADAYRNINFTPDGRSVIYTEHYGDELADTTVYKVDLSGKNPQQLMEAATIIQTGW